MGSGDGLGQFEQLVMTAVLALGEGAYGVPIHARVSELAKPKKISLGAVYATLDRLEDKGLVLSWMSEPTAERGGRARRHFRLQKSGETALRNAATAARRMYETIEQNWGEGLWPKGWKPARPS